MKIRTYPKHITTLVVLTLAILGGPLLQGCTSTKVASANSVTVGQELQDLDAARKAGTITDKEYEQLRKAIIKKHK